MGRILIDDYNGRVAKEQDVMGKEHPICESSAPPRVKIVGYLDVYNGIVREGIAGTLTTTSNRAFIIESMEKKILSYSRDSKGEVVDRHVRDIAGTVHTKEGSCGNTAMLVCEPRILQRPRGENRGGVHEILPTMDSSSFVNNNLLLKEFRVRKLTPSECFRLMDVSDGDIDRIQASGVSRSQQYRMAGNSIVVSVLFHIFRKMFVDTGCDNNELELF